jgi:stage V sporulation protein AD
MGITDVANMGAAMAPSAENTIRCFLEDTGTTPKDYDLIVTGDLGVEGSEILKELLKAQNIDIAEQYNDCGLMIYDIAKQDVHSGGSGCGCSAVVLAGEIMSRLASGLIKKMLFIGTGALMSPTSVQQNQPIVGISHLVRLERV